MSTISCTQKIRHNLKSPTWPWASSLRRVLKIACASASRHWVMETFTVRRLGFQRRSQWRKQLSHSPPLYQYNRLFRGWKESDCEPIWPYSIPNRHLTVYKKHLSGLFLLFSSFVLSARNQPKRRRPHYPLTPRRRLELELWWRGDFGSYHTFDEIHFLKPMPIPHQSWQAQNRFAGAK